MALIDLRQLNTENQKVTCFELLSLSIKTDTTSTSEVITDLLSFEAYDLEFQYFHAFQAPNCHQNDLIPKRREKCKSPHELSLDAEGKESL